MEEIATTMCPLCGRLVSIPINIGSVPGSLTTVSVECDMRELWGHVRWHRAWYARVWGWLTGWR